MPSVLSKIGCCGCIPQRKRDINIQIPLETAEAPPIQIHQPAPVRLMKYVREKATGIRDPTPEELEDFYRLGRELAQQEWEDGVWSAAADTQPVKEPEATSEEVLNEAEKLEVLDNKETGSQTPEIPECPTQVQIACPQPPPFPTYNTVGDGFYAMPSRSSIYLSDEEEMIYPPGVMTPQFYGTRRNIASESGGLQSCPLTPEPKTPEVRAAIAEVLAANNTQTTRSYDRAGVYGNENIPPEPQGPQNPDDEFVDIPLTPPASPVVTVGEQLSNQFELFKRRLPTMDLKPPGPVWPWEVKELEWPTFPAATLPRITALAAATFMDGPASSVQVESSDEIKYPEPALTRDRNITPLLSSRDSISPLIPKESQVDGVEEPKSFPEAQTVSSTFAESLRQSGDTIAKSVTRGWAYLKNVFNAPEEEEERAVEKDMKPEPRPEPEPEPELELEPAAPAEDIDAVSMLSPTPSNINLMREILMSKMNDGLRIPENAERNPTLAGEAMVSALNSGDYTDYIPTSPYVNPFEGHRWDASDEQKYWEYNMSGTSLNRYPASLASNSKGSPRIRTTSMNLAMSPSRFLAAPHPSVENFAMLSTQSSVSHLHIGSPIGSTTRLNRMIVAENNQISPSTSESRTLSPYIESTTTYSSPPARKVTPMWTPQPHREACLSTSGLHMTADRSFYESYVEKLKGKKTWMKVKRSSDF
ncbi:hypothetical protein ABW19_dt0210075 [Dactylella cylindrospora]|nr:hypothetical protein ABW19_dt0210075 [Dactylella cylindrospora]